MIIDTSAILAILKNEEDALVFAQAIESASICRISAVNYVEAAAIIDTSNDPIASRRFDSLITEANIIIEEVNLEQARIARQAYKDFGKGSKHPAKLNFGDCFSYALAKFYNESLLFKGNDFSKTDLA